MPMLDSAQVFSTKKHILSHWIQDASIIPSKGLKSISETTFFAFRICLPLPSSKNGPKPPVASEGLGMMLRLDLPREVPNWC